VQGSDLVDHGSDRDLVTSKTMWIPITGRHSCGNATHAIATEARMSRQEGEPDEKPSRPDRVSQGTSILHALAAFITALAALVTAFLRGCNPH
jgi:hypothetical protein